MEVFDPWEAGQPADEAHKIDIVAQALIDLFGDRALTVSEHQAALGDGGAANAIWRVIVQRIRELRG
jgi:hypothetical protein